jgi:transcriptional regulator with PAS, ATPase and Fis domain
VVSIGDEKIQCPDRQYDPGKQIIHYLEDHQTAAAGPESDHKISMAPKMRKIIHAAHTTAQMDLPILIQGESGTGKSMLAKYIHDIGQRKDQPFMEINCAAIPEALLESELFGYEPYSFTDANAKGKKGLLELADGGTLFLDEIGDLAITLQAKLLDLIENKQFISVGGTRIKQVDVRIIAATNKDLKLLIAEKLFREDLFWRINVMDLMLPPLRERTEDIEYLQQIFLDSANMKYGMKKQFSEEVKETFCMYFWPGNIRQLKNVVERAVVIAKEDLIQLQDLPECIIREAEENKIYTRDYETYMELCTKKIVTDTYNKYQSSRKLAEALDIRQSTASRLIRKYIETEQPI